MISIDVIIYIFKAEMYYYLRTFSEIGYNNPELYLKLLVFLQTFSC